MPPPNGAAGATRPGTQRRIGAVVLLSSLYTFSLRSRCEFYTFSLRSRFGSIASAVRKFQSVPRNRSEQSQHGHFAQGVSSESRASADANVTANARSHS